MYFKFKLIWLCLGIFWFWGNTALAQDSTSVGNNNSPHDQHFVDLNGDGYNDNAPDHDGDGIPNALDPDFKKGHGMGRHHPFRDLDGDGINDFLQGDSPNKAELGEGRMPMKDRTGSMDEDGHSKKGQGNRKMHGGKH